MSKGDPEVASPPPQLGQHTTEVLRELGFADAEIERLRSTWGRVSAKPAPTADQLLQQATAWWTTSIIDIHPGEIVVRGYPIQQLIGELTFPQMIWLMLRGEIPGRAQAKLLEAALVAAVDHGPQAPSIAISRMAVTCGLPMNGAMASAINALDDIHGGAGQQCMELYQSIAAAH